MTHLPLNPVERLMLLQGQDREAVTALPDWSVRNFRSRQETAQRRPLARDEARRSSETIFVPIASR